MQDPLHRLYHTKIVLLATILLFAGLTLLVLGHLIPNAGGWRWLADWPVTDIGSGMFTTGLLGVAWQYIDGNDSEARDTARLKRVLADSAPAMRDAVINGFAFQPGDLARVATDDVLDQIATNSLAIRLGDAGFARELYDSIKQQAVAAPERLHDARISIRLSPLPAGKGTAGGRTRLFVATIRWESSLRPTYQTRRFSCVSDLAEFREIRHENAASSAWYVSPRSGLDASDQETFELLDFTVDGEPRSIRRSSRRGSQTYSVTLSEDDASSSERVTIAYTYRTVIPIGDQLLRLRVDQPTKRLTVELDYTDTDVERVSVLDFISGVQPATITRSSTEVPARLITVEYPGWVFPRSGVAFVWKDAARSGHRAGRPGSGKNTLA